MENPELLKQRADIYEGKASALKQAAEEIEPTVLTSRIPNYLRALANYWYDLAAQDRRRYEREINAQRQE